MISTRRATAHTAKKAVDVLREMFTSMSYLSEVVWDG